MNEKLRKEIRKHLEIVTGSRDSSGGLALQDSLKALDGVAQDRNNELGSDLRHYLENRSYVKALAALKP